MMTSDKQAPNLAADRSRRGRYLPLAIAAVTLFGGYLLGSAGAGQSPAFADRKHDLLHEKELVPISITPPSVAVPGGGWALVGAADDRYYIVREDGTTIEVMPERRQNLLWR